MAQQSERIHGALVRVLLPLARLLLRFGVGYSEFDSIAKAVFVQVATTEYGLRGRPTNISRVATILGLSRREVSRIREIGLPQSWFPEMQKNPINTIVHYWLFDNLFSVAPGSPKVLPYVGEFSFTTLVRKYLGDLPVGAVRHELTSRGAMEVDENDLCRLVQGGFVSSADREDLMQSIFYSIRNILETVEFNARLFDQKRSGARPRDESQPRFERIVWTNKLDDAAAQEFRDWLDKRGQEFLERANKFIGERETHDLREEKDLPLLGVGLYYYQQAAPSAKSE